MVKWLNRVCNYDVVGGWLVFFIGLLIFVNVVYYIWRSFHGL